MAEYEEIRENMDYTKIDTIREYLGDESEYILNHKCQKITKESLHLPGPDYVDRIFENSDRPTTANFDVI